MYVSMSSGLHCIRNELCIPFTFLVSSAARHYSNTFSSNVILFLLHASTKNCIIILDLCYRYFLWLRFNINFSSHNVVPPDNVHVDARKETRRARNSLSCARSPGFLQKYKVYYGLHTIQSPAHDVGQLSTVHSLTQHCFKIHFNIIL
jgi:hypothetical protein